MNNDFWIVALCLILIICVFTLVLCFEMQDEVKAISAKVDELVVSEAQRYNELDTRLRVLEEVVNGTLH